MTCSVNGHAVMALPVMPASTAPWRSPLVRASVLLGLGLLLCAYLVIGTRARAAETCNRPAPKTLIDWYNKAHAQAPLDYNARGSAIYHPISILRTEKPVVYWIGLAWLFPQSGALFAVNCAGTILDGMPTGAIGHLDLGPRLPQVGQSVTIVYVNKETGRCVHDGIRILALKANKIVTLWDHGYNQGINVAASHAQARQFIAENYNVDVTDHGLRLEISGVRKTFPFENGRQSSVASSTETIAIETYQWDAKALRYTPKAKYAPRPICR